MSEPGITMMAARSPQAKVRGERLWKTLQSRGWVGRCPYYYHIFIVKSVINSYNIIVFYVRMEYTYDVR